MSKNMDDYLQEGMYGQKQTKPDERRLFLGSLRERAAFVLTRDQIRDNVGLTVFEEELQKHPDAYLLFNGLLSLATLSGYRRLALKHGIRYTIVDEKTNESGYGLVLTYDHAVDLRDIFYREPKVEEQVTTPKKRSWFDKLFGMHD